MNDRPRRRRGYALIELLVLITIVAVMLGLCAGMLHLLMRLDRVGRSAADEAADMARLGRDFRADAHASPAAGPAGRTPDGITLAVAEGRSVEYRARPTDILRTVREGDKVRHREQYRRPARSAVRFEVARDGPAAIASLTISREPGGKDGSPARDVRIDAALGLDRRFSRRDP